MLASSSSSEAGKRLRAKRERLHLSIRRVEQISQQIAEEKKNPAFYVPHNWVSDLENGKSRNGPGIAMRIAELQPDTLGAFSQDTTPR
jgi:transcriptional regulator with XRE-family HTH domain